MAEYTVVGKKIIGIRRMTAKEKEAEGWDGEASVIVLDDGAVIFASQDEEGNGPGMLFGRNKDGSFYVW